MEHCTETIYEVGKIKHSGNIIILSMEKGKYENKKSMFKLTTVITPEST
jgi:hypothetical protein